jgi:hypothetical protein
MQVLEFEDPHPFRIIVRARIPTGAHYVTLQKCFSHPSLNCLLFSNPTLKTEMGTAITWERLIANHLDQSLWLANQNVEHQSDHIHYALLKQVHIFTALFTSLSKLTQHAGEKSFSWAKPPYVDFTSSNFNLQGHVLSTSGDALTKFHSFKNICWFQSQAVFFFCGECFGAEFLGCIVCWLWLTLISSWVPPSWVTILFIYGRSHHIDWLIIKCFGTLGTPPKKHLFGPQL